MAFIQHLRIALAALRQLGLRQVGLYARYQLGLRSGYYRLLTPAGTTRNRSHINNAHYRLNVDLMQLPARDELIAILGEGGLKILLSEADEIVGGKIRLFDGEPQQISLFNVDPLQHWSIDDRKRAVVNNNNNPEIDLQIQDIKFTWERGRLGWIYPLARAYRLSSNEQYAETFWEYSKTFLDANPPNVGQNWVSAQEVSLRLIGLVFAAQVFANSLHSNSECLLRLGEAIAAHASRIPSTLVYARAQNNNHLLSEAAALFTAGLALPDHPAAKRWRALGWKWFNRGLHAQIAPDGAYVQQSTNYHRLMLQLTLWVNAILHSRHPAAIQSQLPPETHPKLVAATRWLLALVDHRSGNVPNLGPNDGAYIFPVTICPFEDYRPVLQAASQAFLGMRGFDPGPWDEMAEWLGTPLCKRGDVRNASCVANYERSGAPGSERQPVQCNSPQVIRFPKANSWAYLRVAKFTQRPGHADQLHLDLWWRGLNVAQDAGTYLYNGKPPWDNSLARTAVHNTLTVNQRDQMTRAGRFLWLDWAQGQIVSQECSEDGSWERLVTRHTGYLKEGVVHQRTVTAHAHDHWVIEDQLLPSQPSPQALKSGFPPRIYSVRLHWLLPDWQYEIDQPAEAHILLRLKSPHGWIEVHIQSMLNNGSMITPIHPKLVRAGELLFGSGPISPTLGWVSPTYGCKLPALSLGIEVSQPVPLTLTSQWIFPK